MPKRKLVIGESPGIVAELIMKHHGTFVTLRESKPSILYYDSGIYHFGAESLIIEKAKSYCGNLLNRLFVTDLLLHVQASTYLSDMTKPWSEQFDTDLNIVNVRSGLLNIKTGELMEHTPAYLSLSQLPVTYDPEADCPTIRKFFAQVLKPQDIDLVEELFGYCLLKAYPFHRIFLLYGKGENGKSTLLELLRAFLGKDNCSGIPLQTLEEHRFAMSQLQGKLANIVADLKGKALSETGTIKMLTGEDTVTGERKFKDFFTFRNHAKLIFSANNPPIVADDSLAWWRRQVVIEFPNTFPADRRDLNILSKLTIDRELSGLLNIALGGLRRLLSNGDFSYKPKPMDVQKQYSKLSDSAKAFVEENCHFSPDALISKPHLYKLYCDYCDQWNIPKKDPIGFSMRLKQLYPDIMTGKLTVGKERQNCYQGIGCEGISVPFASLGLSEPEDSEHLAIVADITEEQRQLNLKCPLKQRKGVTK